MSEKGLSFGLSSFPRLDGASGHFAAIIDRKASHG
jgi:hypothetical protein